MARNVAQGNSAPGTRTVGLGETFAGSRFHEAVLTLPRPVAPLLEALSRAAKYVAY